VVSGLARGCDTGAHRGAVRADGRTTAVMPCGLGRVHPPENRELARAILDSGGCLLSEYPPSERPRRDYFIRRDELQAALSLGLVVIESDLRSGTMHTVRFGRRQNKPIACLSHPPEFNTLSVTQGNRMLIAGGDAAAVRDIDELKAFMAGLPRAEC
jgi:DNA processing protein